MAWLSLMGLYNAFPDLFDNISFPAGLDKETVVNTLCIETSDMELLWADPMASRLAMETWAKRRLPIWEKLYKTTTFEYEPLHNYDRTEERSRGETINTTSSSTSKQDDQRNINNDRTTEKAGYNDGEMVVSESVTSSESDGYTAFDNYDTDSSQKTDEGESIRAFGNIGVTSTQQLIEQEREVQQFDIIQFILDDFKTSLCIMLY